jgi:ribosomal protein S18 acetylase RimI-like enzyme
MLKRNSMIRLLRIDDYSQVYKLWTQIDGMGMRSLDDSKEGIEKFLKRNPTTNFVAVEDNQIVGIILCGHDGRRAYIYHTAVKEDYRKQGIAKLLVEYVKDSLLKEGIHKVALVAFKSNQLGNDFWQSVGFTKRDDLYYRNLSLNSNNK